MPIIVFINSVKFIKISQSFIEGWKDTGWSWCQAGSETPWQYRLHILLLHIRTWYQSTSLESGTVKEYNSTCHSADIFIQSDLQYSEWSMDTFSVCDQCRNSTHTTLPAEETLLGLDNLSVSIFPHTITLNDFNGYIIQSITIKGKCTLTVTRTMELSLIGLITLLSHLTLDWLVW